jgi:G:T/U-mismatch repair DNA glycosylase
VKRLVVIAVAVTAFLAVCVVVTRWLSADTDERGQVVELLRAQSRGDVDGMLRRLQCRDRACIAVVRANARRLRGHGELKIPLYESGTAHALRSRTKQTRVVWFTSGRLTTVQCVLVRRTGNVFAGTSVSLLRLSAPIGRQSSCP